MESVLPLPGHKQRDLRDEELGGSGSRVEQLTAKFGGNERDVKKATKRPPITAIESGRVSGSSSLNLPADLRRGMQTEDLVEEQKKLLAAAARNKKEKDGQPAGSASGVDEDFLYVQRQRSHAILEKVKSQETHPGKSNTESLPNQKGANHQGFGLLKRPQAARNDGGFEMVQWLPREASAADSHSMRHHDCSIHPDLEICSGGQVQLSKDGMLDGIMEIDTETTFATSDEIKRLRGLLKTAQAEKSQFNARLQTAEKEREELEVKLVNTVKERDGLFADCGEEEGKLADIVKERDEMLRDERVKLARIQKENHQLRKQIVNDSQIHDQQNRWFKKKLSMVKSENEEYKKRIDEIAELSQINLDSVSVSKRKLGGGSFGGILACPLSSSYVYHFL